MKERGKVQFDFKQLEVFCAIAKFQSFSKAAEYLSLSQPTITAHISALEKLLSVKLFDRTTRRVILTSAGKFFYNHAKGLLNDQKIAHQEMTQFLKGLTGQVIFGASTVAGQYILPPIMFEFFQQFPKVRLKMNIATSRNVLERVLNGDLEFGVISYRPKGHDLKIFPLWKDKVVLIAPKGHELATKEFVSIHQLLSQPFVSTEEGSGTRIAVERFLRQKGVSKRLNIIAELGNAEAVKQFVSVSNCVGFVPAIAVKNKSDENQFVIIHLTEGRITHRFYGLIHIERTLSPACSAFLRFCVKSKNKGYDNR